MESPNPASPPPTIAISCSCSCVFNNVSCEDSKEAIFEAGSAVRLIFDHEDKINVSIVSPGPKAAPRILAGSFLSRASIIFFNANNIVGEDMLP